MKDSNKMKVINVIRVMNIAFCCLAMGLGVFENNALAACGWLATAFAYIQVIYLRRHCEDWKSVCSKTVDLFHTLFGIDGNIASTNVKRFDNKSEEEKKEPEKELPDFAPKAAESFHECAKEFFHYVEEGNREFSVSHGGVTVSVSIHEDNHAHAEGA